MEKETKVLSKEEEELNNNNNNDNNNINELDEDIKNELSEKLKKRPKCAKDAGLPMIDTKLAPSIVATAQKLDKQKKMDCISQSLNNRPDCKEVMDHNINITSIAPSLQSTAKKLEYEQKRDSLSHSLHARPAVDDLIDSGILKPYALNLAKCLQMDANELEQSLATRVSKEYLQNIGILDPYTYNVDHSNQESIDKVSSLLLEHFLKQKNFQLQYGSNQYFKNNEIKSPLFASKAKELQKHQTVDKLKKKLEHRPSKENIICDSNELKIAPSLIQTIRTLGKELIKDQLTNALRNQSINTESHPRIRSGSFDETKLAPSLQSVAKQLYMEQKKDFLADAIKKRPDLKELINSNILKPYAIKLAKKLQLDASKLEQQLAIRVSKDNLKQIGILDPYKHNVDESSIDVNDEKTHLLLDELIKNHTTHSRHFGSMDDSKLDRIAPMLQSTAKKLEYEKTKDAVSKSLQHRPNAKDIGINTAISPKLQSTTKQLEIQQKKDMVSQNLQHRSDINQIPNINTSIAPSLQSTAKKLEYEQKRDSLSHSLHARPAVDDLIDSGILKPYALNLAKCLQMDANELEQSLATRVSKEYLQHIGVLDPYKHNVDHSKQESIDNVSALLLTHFLKQKEFSSQYSANRYKVKSPTIETAAKDLQKHQTTDKLKKKLSHRPSMENVTDSILDSNEMKNVAPSLIQTIRMLGKELIKDQLHQTLKNRKSAQELGIDINTAKSIQPAIKQLEQATKRDTLSKSLKNRPKEIGTDYNLSRALQAIAKKLEHELKVDEVSRNVRKVNGKKHDQHIIATIDELINFVCHS